jgi:hypothetical protein
MPAFICCLAASIIIVVVVVIIITTTWSCCCHAVSRIRSTPWSCACLYTAITMPIIPVYRRPVSLLQISLAIVMSTALLHCMCPWWTSSSSYRICHPPGNLALQDFPDGRQVHEAPLCPQVLSSRTLRVLPVSVRWCVCSHVHSVDEHVRGSVMKAR